MIDMRAYAALPDEVRERQREAAAMVQRGAARTRAELILAEAALIVMRHFGDEVASLKVLTAPCWFGDTALISEIEATDGSTLWASLRRGEPAGKPWDGEQDAQDLITMAWSISTKAFRPVDEEMGLYEVRLHRASEVAR